MKLPKFRLLKAADATVEAIEQELATLDRAVVDAETELHSLGAKRLDLLLHGTDDAIVTHDSAMARTRTRMEQAQARRAALQPEWEVAQAREAAERTARERADTYAAAVAARAEAADLLRDYMLDAEALGRKVARLAAIRRQIDAANADLPEGVEPLWWVETSNAVAGYPHSFLVDRVRLPGAKQHENFWIGREAAGPPLSAEAAAFLRHHGVAR